LPEGARHPAAGGIICAPPGGTIRDGAEGIAAVGAAAGGPNSGGAMREASSGTCDPSAAAKEGAAGCRLPEGAAAAAIEAGASKVAEFTAQGAELADACDLQPHAVK